MSFLLLVHLLDAFLESRAELTVFFFSSSYNQVLILRGNTLQF